MLLACTRSAPEVGNGASASEASRPSAEATSRSAPVRPGITVLLEDSVHLIRGKRIGLVTNHTGLDERGQTDIDLLAAGERARAAGARVVALYAPEHGIRGTEDRAVSNSVDEKTGVPIYSLYGAGSAGPADTTLKNVDVIVYDLQDIGTRTWTYVGVMIYSMRSAKRNNIPIIVLDRPNPVTGMHVEGPVLDSTVANADDPTPERRGLAWALWPFPLRHGMTIGEMARFYNDTLGIGANLHVMPASGWRRSMWWSETGLRFVPFSPNIRSEEAALLYPSVVAFEATTISVGRGTPLGHRLVGAPGLNTKALIAALEDRELPGVRFRETTFAGTNYGPQQPYTGQTLPGVEIVIADRERIQSGRLGAALVWALLKTNPGVFAIRDTLRFDRLFGSGRARRALMAGDDPDSVMDRELPDVVRFNQLTRRYHLYR